MSEETKSDEDLELAAAGITIIEDDDEEVIEATIDDDFADVPQGKPEGIRVGGDAARTIETCSTCHGVGAYPVEIFSEADEEGVRHVETIQQGCATCNGTGRELMLS